MNHTWTVVAIVSILACCSLVRRAEMIDVLSPDGSLHAALLKNTNGELCIEIKRQEELLLLPSRVGIIVDGEDLGSNVIVGQVTTSSESSTYPTWGSHNVATNKYHAAIIPVKGGPGEVSWTLELRVFDDAVAYRYRVPGENSRQVTGESTEWHLPTRARIWFQPDNDRRDYEAAFKEQMVSEMGIGTRIAAPATFKVGNAANSAGNGNYLMFTEANLINYTDMALEVSAADTFTAFFHNSPQGWNVTGEIVSPWRVTVVAKDLTTLVNTDVIRNLCPAPAAELAGADWIKPGRATWHWMVTRGPKLPEQRQWVDWTSTLGYEYYIIDDGWKTWKTDGKDAWACMKDIIDYARTKHVKIFAWVNCNEITTPNARRMYFTRASEIGVAGLKIDFMKPADLDWVKWYDDTLRDSAAAHLMVNFHGASKPTGGERTWPHELTREAIKGREGGKLPGVHDTSIPFVRFVQGPADYTPTEFRPEVMKSSTWSRELAQAIVYTSPLLCLSGSPEDYLSNPAAEVIKNLPATWDETIVLDGSEIGHVAAFARRKGTQWFIGVVNGSTARTMQVPLLFLPRGKTFIAKQFADAPDENDAYVQSQGELSSNDVIILKLKSDGGYVGWLVETH